VGLPDAALNEQVSVAVFAEPDRAVQDGVGLPVGGAGDTDNVGVLVGVGSPLSPETVIVNVTVPLATPGVFRLVGPVTLGITWAS
jgi:hypothetical protein